MDHYSSGNSREEWQDSDSTKLPTCMLYKSRTVHSLLTHISQYYDSKDKQYLPIDWSDPRIKDKQVIVVFQSHLPDTQTSLVCLSGKIFMQKMGMGYWWNDTDREKSVPAPIRPPLISHGVNNSDKGKPEYMERSLSERLLFHHKSPMA
jgi:hypothetical protein